MPANPVSTRAVPTPSPPSPIEDQDLTDKTHQARVIALSLAQCDSVAELLRANDHPEQAGHVEAAMRTVLDLMAEEVGHVVLGDALTWLQDKRRTRSDILAAPGPLH